jgi:hypothetical protein
MFAFSNLRVIPGKQLKQEFPVHEGQNYSKDSLTMRGLRVRVDDWQRDGYPVYYIDYTGNEIQPWMQDLQDHRADIHVGQFTHPGYRLKERVMVNSTSLQLPAKVKSKGLQVWLETIRVPGKKDTFVVAVHITYSPVYWRTRPTLSVSTFVDIAQQAANVFTKSLDLVKAT